MNPAASGRLITAPPTSPRWPALSKPLPNVPADYASRLVKNDFAWAAKNRDRILAEWSKRYESKAAPK